VVGYYSRSSKHFLTTFFPRLTLTLVASITTHPTDTDTVPLITFHPAATVGPTSGTAPACKPHRSLHLHLSPFYLDMPGQSDDDIAGPLHYEHLARWWRDAWVRWC
jgi:hypothetical protein